MLQGVKLKWATEVDIDAMQQAGDTLFDYEVKPERVKEFVNDPRHHIVLAYYNTKIIGFASGFHYVHPDKDPAMFVNEVTVLDVYQNQEIGRQLVKYLIEYSKQLGCTEAWVATEQSNIAARKSYIAAGGIEDKEPIVLLNFEFNK